MKDGKDSSSSASSSNTDRSFRKHQFDLYFVTSHWFLYNLAFLTHKNNVKIEHECLSMLVLVMPNDIGCANK